MSEVSQETMMFKREPEKLNVAETIKEVYAALEKKGYNPVDQLAGYLLSGDLPISPALRMRAPSCPPRAL